MTKTFDMRQAYYNIALMFENQLPNGLNTTFILNQTQSLIEARRSFSVKDYIHEKHFTYQPFNQSYVNFGYEDEFKNEVATHTVKKLLQDYIEDVFAADDIISIENDSVTIEDQYFSDDYYNINHFYEVK